MRENPQPGVGIVVGLAIALVSVAGLFRRQIVLGESLVFPDCRTRCGLFVAARFVRRPRLTEDLSARGDATVVCGGQRRVEE